MIEAQKLVEVSLEGLCVKVKEYHDAGYRLVQIGATRTDVFELNYSFDKGYEFVNVRLVVPSQEVAVPSVSGIYWNAFLYENEIHDLFGLTITGIAIDYGGKFLRTSVRSPFGDKK